MQVRDTSPQRLPKVLEMNNPDDNEKKNASASFKSDSSTASRQTDSRRSETGPTNLKQQLNSYYSWTSSFYERGDNDRKPDPKRLSDSSFRDLLSDSSAPLYNKSKPLTEAELSESRKRALQRLTDKRKEMEMENQRKAEQSRINDNMPRVRWRGGIKKKRLQEIDDTLDQSIIQDTVTNDPTLLIHALGINETDQEKRLSRVWDELLDGLEVDNTSNMRSPFKRFADNMKRQLLLSQSDMLHQNKIPRMRIDSSIVQPTAKSFLRKISDGMSGIATNALTDRFNKDEKVPRNLQNKDDLNELAASNLNEQQGMEEKKVNGSEPGEAVATDNDVLSGTFDLFYRKSNRTKRSSGLLSKFVDKVNVAESGDAIGIAHIAAEGGYYLIPGYYDPNSEAGTKLTSDASFARYFQRFADTVFVAGPLPEDIYNLAESSAGQFYDGSNENLNSLSLKLEPHTLFMTKCDEEVDAQSLPKFCFPCWIDVSAKKVSKDDKPTLSKPTIAGTNSQGIGPNWNRRNNFVHPGKVFSFILSNHTRKDYAICLSVHRSFHYPSLGVTIDTDYVIAIISHFPFISYFAHLLEQFDACGGFAIDDPLPVQEDGFPILPELRAVNDLAQRLNRLLVPGYNGVVPESELPLSDTTQPKQQLELFQNSNQRSISSTDDAKVCILNHHVPIPFNLIFGRGSAHQKSRIDLTFKRDTFQTYYGRSEMNPLVQPELIYKNLYTPTEEQENEREREVSHHLLLWSLPILLNYLSLDDLLLVLGCMMTEMKTIVCASDPTVLSGCVVALMTLLDPLKWVSTIIVILPDEFTEYLETPSPLIAGVESLPEGFQNAVEGVIIIKPEERKVCLHVNDVVASHTLQLPRAHKLAHVLKPHVEAILKLTRKAKENLRYPQIMHSSGSTSPPAVPSRPGFDDSVEQSTFSNTGATSAQPTDQVHMFPIPIDVDVESERGKALLTAIKKFADEVSEHIQTIINTSLQLAWEIRRSSRHERHNRRQIAKTPGNRNTSTRRAFMSDSSSISLVSDLTDGSGDYITTLTETDSTETAGSLPSVNKDAPVLPTTDIGEGGLKFIKRLQETQLYSVYCYSKSSKRKEEHEVDDVWDAYKLRENQLAVVNEEQNEEHKDSSSQGDQALSGNQIAISTPERNTMDENDEDSSTFKEDPLILLFQIMLSGTMPMTTARLEGLQEIYQTSNSNQENLSQRIYWCNGRCSGLANTPFCTNICMLLWEQRVEHVRQQMRIKDVIERQHHSDYVLNTKMRVEVMDDEGYVQQSKEVSIKPRPVITKHKRETESQYQRRKLEILASHSLSQEPNTSSSFPPLIDSGNELSPINIVPSPGDSLNTSPIAIERRGSDNISLASSDLQDPRDMNDDLMSLDLPALPLLPRSPSTSTKVPLPADVFSNYGSYTSAYNSNHPQAAVDSEVVDTQSIASLTESFRSGSILTKKDSKYSMMYQSKKPRPVSISAYSGTKRMTTQMQAAKSFVERPTPALLKVNRTPQPSRTASKPVRAVQTEVKAPPIPPSIYAPRVGPNGAPSRRLYARGTASPVIKAIATHYARKQKLRLRQHIVFALNLVQTSILTFILRKRYLQQRVAVMTLQRYMRGYLLRHVYLKHYIDFVIQYRCGKIFARMLFKKWIKSHIAEIIQNYRHRKAEMLAKRLSNQQALLPAAAISSMDLLASEKTSLPSSTTSLGSTYPPPSNTSSHRAENISSSKKSSIFSNFISRSSHNNLVLAPVSQAGDLSSSSASGDAPTRNAYSAPPTPHVNTSGKSMTASGGIAGPIRHQDSSDSDLSQSLSPSTKLAMVSEALKAGATQAGPEEFSSTRSSSPHPPLSAAISRQSSIDPTLSGPSTSRQDHGQHEQLTAEQIQMALSHEDIYAHHDYDAVNTLQDEEYMFMDEDEDSLKGPLRSLGPEAQNALTPQQVSYISAIAHVSN
jgi:hypothetical protein